MKAVLTAAFFLGMCATAHAFNTCTTTPFSLHPAYLPEEQQDPAVAGKNIYAAYSTLGTYALVFKASHDEGVTWSQLVLDKAGLLPRIAVDGKFIYVVWFSKQKGVWYTVFARSGDGGKSFTTRNLGRTWLAFEPSEDNEAQIAVTDSLVSVIFASGAKQMKIATSNDKGRTFTHVALTSPSDPEEEYNAAVGNNIVAVWNGKTSDGLDKNIMSISKDGGKTFSTPVNMTADGLEDVEPQLTVSPNTGAIYMVWREAKSSYGLTVGFISKSTDFGVTWSKPALIDPEAKHARQFAVAASDPNVYVAYLRNKTPNTWWTQLTISRDAGDHFDPPVALASTGVTGVLYGEKNAPRIWVNENLFRIVFDVGGALAVSSSTDNGVHLAPNVSLGTGSGALITQNVVLWRDPKNTAMLSQCQ